MIIWYCPECGTEDKVDGKMVGMLGPPACPKCKNPIRMRRRRDQDED